MMMMMEYLSVTLLLKICLSIGLVGVLSLFVHLYNVLWLKPERRRWKIQRQGIGGPPPSFLYGNIPEMKKIQQQQQQSKAMAAAKNHNNKVDLSSSSSSSSSSISHTDWPSILFPYLEEWRNKYGQMFMYSTGNIQFLYMNNPDVVKEISLCTALELGKPSYLAKERKPLFGDGILVSSGKVWAHQRKSIAPELYLNKVKGMIKLMVESTESLLRAWESSIEGNGGISNIRVDEHFRSVAADIISRACFGSNYSKGEEIFLKLRDLQRAISQRSLLIGVPGVRFIPSKNNREIWRLEKEIRSLILNVVKERREAGYEKDLLQMILESAASNNNQELDENQFIVDNCKNIYFAGHETSATTASWCLMLLALYPEWQDRARAEVVDVYNGHHRPDADMLRKLKTLTMVIQETMRLYPPAAFVSREPSRDMKFGEVDVPEGVNIWIPVSTFHHDPEIWGHDAHMFNPERFAKGIFGACKFPHAYMPFGMGTRTCVGQNFAMIELKVLLSLVLLKFSFSISPNYHHSPAFRLVIEPGNGMELFIRRVD
ncbi:cytochrome P450 714C2-like [Telopea speciosissima]|uniref:cytochrome P450 714C2-like n=1 Tax=Telopea speciosissima TaxID=54955 RepID=UPI001CC6D001|nr:cytochrome P450 714C2-like [Telopea speciosissima]